jgi:transcriptional regulator with PAS, ATPase and Fis domain
LLLGESGTGKEFVANQLHALSPRARGAFRLDLYYRVAQIAVRLLPGALSYLRAALSAQA